jgi:Response regulators consisting of a CheY-like receiver domain and a winged-helix DNA-binding domain
MIKLLLVEDDADLCYIVKSSLEYMIGGYEVITAANGEEGLDAYKLQCPDIIVADIEMPVMDGFDMVVRIRELDGDVPILFASGHISPKDVISGYRIGANNYIKKPFVPEEMDAHIKAMLKTFEGKRMRNETNVFTIGGYQFDADRSILVNNDGEKRLLTTFECKILYLLAKNKGEVVKRETIECQCWGEDKVHDFFVSRSLDVFINKLRNYFKNDETIEIKTLRNVGLMLKERTD